MTELGISILFRLEHPQKAQPPIKVTELGISILVRRLQPSKATFPIAVTEFGIIEFLHPYTSDPFVISNKQLLTEQYEGLFE